MIRQLFSVDSLVAGYGNKTIIRNFSFSLNNGSFYLLAGNNGSGKSTLLNWLGNPMHRVNAVFDVDKSIAIENHHRHFALLSQHNQIRFDLSVQELIEAGAYNNGLSSDEGKLLLNEVVDLLKLRDFLGHNINDLSGGEQQMVWVAQTLMRNKAVLLFDEPTQHLDPKRKTQLFEVLWQLTKPAEGLLSNKCVVVSSHDIPFLPKDHKPHTFLFTKGQQPETIIPENFNAEKILTQLFN